VSGADEPPEPTPLWARLLDLVRVLLPWVLFLSALFWTCRALTGASRG
jgi:hypothetical protein